jgi:hypothetical protein
MVAHNQVFLKNRWYNLLIGFTNLTYFLKMVYISDLTACGIETAADGIVFYDCLYFEMRIAGSIFALL